MPRAADLPVAEHELLASGYFRFSVRDLNLADKCRPGMFFEVKAASTGQERRLFKPLSVFEVEGDRISFLAKQVGPGTAALASLGVGDTVRLIGPLGNAFPLVDSGKALLVSGGIGYPPLAYLRKALTPRIPVHFIHGGACAEDVFPCDRVYTEDGSAGKRGLVTSDIPAIIREEGITVVYSCGPLPMLKAISAIVKGLPHFTSLEAYMACGIGVCHGCAVPVGEGYARVCAEGPVFNAADIRWEDL